MRLRLAGGRALPPLLFVTDRAALARNVGALEAESACAAVRDAGGRLLTAKFDDDEARATRLVRAELARFPAAQGVVLLGGYDVIPPHRMDALPRSVRRAVHHHADGDDFIVWNDDLYGDLDGDGWPELPVSRLPDAHSGALLLTMLSAPAPRSGGVRTGIRNLHRRFADDVFAELLGRARMQRWQPAPRPRSPGLSGERVYLMLHGSHSDARLFWGENPHGDLREALHVEGVPRDGAGGVVFSGCCWGALTVDTIARDAGTHHRLAVRVPEASLALTFLQRGANAFVGCTGMHYSPMRPPFDYFGKPMHRAFFRGSNAGLAPARALFEAKRAYAAAMPHGQRARMSLAVEYKVLREFTCLGLGW